MYIFVETVQFESGAQQAYIADGSQLKYKLISGIVQKCSHERSNSSNRWKLTGLSESACHGLYNI